MKTAQEMYNYCKDNDFGKNFNSDSWGLKHFQVLEKNLLPNENARICFMGIYYDITNEPQGYYAFALTDKRLILAQKKFLGGDVTKFISYENINDVTKKNELIGTSYLIFDTYKETFKVFFGGKEADKIYPVVENFLLTKKIEHISNSSPADELRKYKQLCDDGIITQKEFEEKKKQLLNL